MADIGVEVPLTCTLAMDFVHVDFREEGSWKWGAASWLEKPWSAAEAGAWETGSMPPSSAILRCCERSSNVCRLKKGMKQEVKIEEDEQRRYKKVNEPLTSRRRKIKCGEETTKSRTPSSIVENKSSCL
jgi:hypothetical protein